MLARCLLTIVPFLLVPAAAVGQPPAGPVSWPGRTAFLPSRDMLQVVNPSGDTPNPASVSFKGTCDGGSEWSVAWYRDRKKAAEDPAGPRILPNLAKVGHDIEKLHGGKVYQGEDSGKYFLKQMVTDAQEWTQRYGGQSWQTEGTDQPFHQAPKAIDLPAQINADITRTGVPQTIGVRFSWGYHALVAYDCVNDQAGNRMVFRIGDTNNPSRDDHTLVYDKQRRTWEYHWTDAGGKARVEHGDRYAIMTKWDPLRAEGRGDQPNVPNPVKEIRPAEPNAQKFDRMVRMALEPPDPKVNVHVQAERIRRDLGIPKSGTVDGIVAGQAVAARDPQTGGVLVQFDPALWDRADPEQIARFEAGLEKVLRGQSDGMTIRLRDVPERLAMVSLSHVLQSGSRTLGRLTRVRGYILSGDDVVLLGEVQAGRPKIDTDVLTAALETIWQEGMEPYVSLDPDASDYTRPHKARIGGMPQRLRKSEFTRILLEADYLLKRILLNEEAPQIEGFRSWADILAEQWESRQGRTSFSRMWFVPLQVTVGDVCEARKAGATAAIFESNVRLKTETQVLVDQGATSTGEPDPADLETVGLVTEHYAALAARYPEFQRLLAAFDVCKLAAVLRAKEVRSPVLEEVARRPVREVAIRESYPGIGPKQLGDAGLEVAGGVAIKALYVPPQAFTPAAGLEKLLDAGGEGGWADGEKTAPAVALPTLGELSGIDAPAVAALGLLDQARAAVNLGDHRRALALLDRILEQHPNMPEMRQLRGLILFQAGEPAKAQADLDAVIARQPRNALALYLRTLLRLSQRQVDRAAEDAEAAIAADPTGSRGAMAQACVCHARGQIQEALRTLDAAIARDPRTAELYVVKARVLHMANRPSEAIAVCDEATRFAPGWVQPYVVRAEARMKKGDSRGALADWNRVFELGYRKGEVYSQRAAVRIDCKEYAGALDDATKGLALNPEDATARFTYGIALLANGKPGEAIEPLKKASQQRPEIPAVWRMLAAAYTQTGDAAEAARCREEFRRLTGRDVPPGLPFPGARPPQTPPPVSAGPMFPKLPAIPDFPSLPKPIDMPKPIDVGSMFAPPRPTHQPSEAGRAQARRDVEQGQEALRQGSRMLAEFHFNAAIQNDPTNADAYEGYAQAKIQAITVLDYAQVVKDLKKAKELDPQRAKRIDGLLREAGRGAAKLFVGRGKKELDEDHQPYWAEKSFDDAVHCDPESADAYEGRGRARLEQSKRAEAATDLRRAVELDPARAEKLKPLLKKAESSEDLRK